MMPKIPPMIFIFSAEKRTQARSHVFFLSDPDEGIENLAVLEQYKSRNAHEVELPLSRAVLIDVYFIKSHLPGILLIKLVDYRIHGFARAAPRSPKIN